MQFIFAVLSIAIKQTTFRAIFCLDKTKKIKIAKYNNNQSKIATIRDWNKLKEEIVK